jgi:DNA polymerase
MTDARETLRDYVHFLREREGVRDIRLTRAAREGLAQLVGSASPGSRRPPGDGSPRPAAPVSQPTSTTPLSTEPVARRSTATTEPTAAQRAAATIPAERLEISGSTKVDQLAHLAERAAACVKCPHLVARRHNVVFGVGDPEAKLMFVGEGPGEEEDMKGEPFIGKAGQLLTKMIIAMGLTREQVYIANIVKCRPDMPAGAPGNRKPTKQEMETCVPYLRAQIDVIKPAVLVALGATAVEGLINATGAMGSLRGRFHDYRGIPVMPTYHPSYLLRNQSPTEKRKVWEDLLQVMEKLELPITDKQRGFFLAR